MNSEDGFDEKEQVLTELGLSKNEAKVYLSLLRLGEATAGDIADQSKLHRPNVYDAVERLCSQGFASHYMKDKVKVFQPTDPDHLLRLCSEREQKLRAILPRLKIEREISDKKDTVAEVYEGISAFRRALENHLTYGKPIYAIGLPAYVPDLVKNFIGPFHQERIKKKILMKHIYNEDAADRIKYLNSLEYTEAAYLPQEFNTPTSTIVCGDEILLISWKPLVFVRVINQTLASAWSHYCELLMKSTKTKPE